VFTLVLIILPHLVLTWFGYWIEVDYYITVQDKYGTPLDSRHRNIKLDWLSWGAALGNSKSFLQLMKPIYKMIHLENEPLSDLYDSATGLNVFQSSKGFRGRPVLGGIFARMLIN